MSRFSLVPLGKSRPRGSLHRGARKGVVWAAGDCGRGLPCFFREDRFEREADAIGDTSSAYQLGLATSPVVGVTGPMAVPERLDRTAGRDRAGEEATKERSTAKAVRNPSVALSQPWIGYT